MRDHSNGKYPSLALVLTPQGYRVGEVGRRFTGDQVTLVKQYADEPPTDSLVDALQMLEDVKHSRQHQPIHPPFWNEEGRKKPYALQLTRWGEIGGVMAYYRFGTAAGWS